MMSNLRAPFVLTQALAAQAPDPVPDARGEPVAQALVVNMIDQRVLQAHARVHDLHARQGGALVAHPDGGAGARATGARQRHRPRPDDARRTASPRRISPPSGAATILGRGSDADDIVRALRYLLAAPAVTGQLICVDGGQHLGWRTPDIIGG